MAGFIQEFMGNFMPQQAPQTFKTQYRAYPLAFTSKPESVIREMENGDKILLPKSALDTLSYMNVEYPLKFRISSGLGKEAHCGVIEFHEYEGHCYMPVWLMSEMFLSEGDLITVENVSLPKANWVKFRPMSKTFLDIPDHKAVLEYQLRKFSCLTEGNQIKVSFADQVYMVEVQELKPAKACSIIECDLSVEFAPPADYVEPVRTIPTPVLDDDESSSSDEEIVPMKFQKTQNYIPFGGTGKKVTGKVVKEASNEEKQRKREMMLAAAQRRSMSKFTAKRKDEAFSSSGRRVRD
eukprot:TRINITY_DN1234_c0_g1_i2.p1 TRINITY_DN1234_c0_g1~~TRINITY_DN1234_c0_g1_i2.p1  ORF type:complete len:295 (+),score=75.94 TRINITY_DN1234_c0_g1_i2:58-942(+)